MLVLSRREAQSIVIGGNVVVTVVSVRGDQVRLGIEAPRSITVHRQEVAVAIEAANKEALVLADINPSSLPMPEASDLQPEAPDLQPEASDLQPEASDLQPEAPETL